ncbi:MAG: hypothetical protein IKO72_05220 [Kiritimatiellae bacterium]|nr:hypothetical protein [Kiritimatiellia bacterium]
MNHDELYTLWVGMVGKVRDLFRRKVDFVYESRGHDFPNKRFLVIRRGGNCGLFSYFGTVLGGIRYAVQNGYVPVVDMQTLPNIYLMPNEIGRVNAWEYYFDQPAGFTLRDIEHAEHVVVQKDFAWPSIPRTDYDSLTGNNEDHNLWKPIIARYIRFQPRVIAMCAVARERIFGKSKEKVLGVFLRGTDYVRLRPYLHPVQPTVEQVIEDARNALAEFDCDRLFLVTEDILIARAFRQSFGDDIVFTVNDNYIDYRGGFLGDNQPSFIREHELYQRGMEYVINVKLLSECRYILSSFANCSCAAALLATEKQVSRYYDIGLYGRFGRIIPNVAKTSRKALHTG